MNEIWEQFKGIFAGGLEQIAEALSFLGTNRWAAAIIVLTIIVKTLMLPLVVKQFKSQRAMARLQPEMKRLQQKYRNDRQRLFQEQQELWKREGVNPYGSCLPTVAQFPVLWAMYFSIRELSNREMSFFGLGNLAGPARESIAGWVLLIVMTVAQIWQTKQMSAFQDKRQARLFYAMPVVFLVFGLNFPAGLVLYWTVQTLYQVGFQTLMLKLSPEEPPAAANGGKPARNAKQGPPGRGKGGRDGGDRVQPKRPERAPTPPPSARETRDALDRKGRPDGRRGEGRRRRGARPA